MKRAGIRNIGVNALFKLHAWVAAEVVSLPVSCTVGAFAPVFFYIITIYIQFISRRLIKTRKISAEHDEVRAHGKRKRQVVIVNDSAVGADRNINSGFFEVLITSRSNLDNCSRLSAADALLFTRNADGATADTDLHEVRPNVRKVAETFAVNDIACTDLHTVAVFFAHPANRICLPLTVTLGTVDAKHIHACLNQRRDSFFVVTRVDACAYNISLMLVQKFVRIILVRIIVFAENKMRQSLIFVDNRKCVQLVVPKNVIRFTQGDS